MRKPGSQFDQVCKFINSLPIGSEYTCKQLRDACSSVASDRLGYIHCMLNKWRSSAGVLQRVKRGTYRILAHIPDFVTYNMLEANWGYEKQNPNWVVGSTEPRWILRGKKWKAGEPNPNVENAEISTPTNTKFVSEYPGNDLIERLDGLMTIKNDCSFVDENEIKYIYKYASGEITKHRVHKTYFTAGKIGQTESLTEALINISDLTGPMPETIAEDMLEKIEEQIFLSEDKKFSDKKVIVEEKPIAAIEPKEVKVESKLITMEDLRDKEVYWIKRGEILKGKIVSFRIEADEDSTRYEAIKVAIFNKEGAYEYFDDPSEYYTSKQQLHDKMTSIIDEL